MLGIPETIPREVWDDLEMKYNIENDKRNSN